MMADSPSEPVVTSFYMDTSAGGIPITLCACGLLMYQPMALVHMATCSTYQRHSEGDSRSARHLQPRRCVMKDAVDLLNDQLTVARNEFAAYKSMAEAQIEVMERTLAGLRCVADAAFSVVRDDGAEDGWTTWQELVSALEDINYQPREVTE